METVLSSAGRRVEIGWGKPLVLIGERINPTGRKALSLALEQGDLSLVRSEARRQALAGADVLDVNVGISGVDEASLLRDAVQAVQEVTDAPLCIDSASPKALEAGLSVYKGRPLVNSVNGEQAKLEAVLPLVAAHKAAVIGLTTDDAGIPKEAEGRLAIAERILQAASRHGIPPEDVIIDPLALGIGTDSLAGIETLKAIGLIRERLGVNQTLGLSNISFGLPERQAINTLFLAMAVQNGVTCPILDVTRWEVRRAALIVDLLLGRDDYCMRFIEVYREQEEQGQASL